MREEAYTAWMIGRGLETPTQSTSMSALRRIETAYGSLDEAFAEDGLEGILSDLAYSKSDERSNEPGPDKLKLGGNLYNSLSSLRTHINYYRRFIESLETLAVVARVVETAAETPVLATPLPTLPFAAADPPEAVLSMERDLNAALRQSIGQLESGLAVTDGGKERSVASGRIDILAEDSEGKPVVIELKAVTAPRDSVAQVLSYMGDIAAEANKPVRGFLVAPDFDPRAISAARMVPNLRLVRYRFNFSFTDVSAPSEDK